MTEIETVDYSSHNYSFYKIGHDINNPDQGWSMHAMEYDIEHCLVCETEAHIFWYVFDAAFHEYIMWLKTFLLYGNLDS